MKNLYVADKEGNLLYWIDERNGQIMREYPDGRTEAADEQEIRLYNR